MAEGSDTRASWWRRSWPHLRCGLILLHLLAIFLLALPSNYKMADKNHWKKPKQQKEISAWADRLGVDKEDFESFLWSVSTRYVAMRKAVIRPFAKYADYTGARQGWAMFASPRMNGGRFDVYVQERGEWRLIYSTGTDADWRVHQFTHNRIRKLIGRLTNNPQQGAYNEMSNWMARMVAKDFPDATRAKVQFFRWKSLSAARIRAGELPKPALVRSQEFALEGLR